MFDVYCIRAEMLLLLSMSTVLLSVSAQENLAPYGKATQSSQLSRGIPGNALNPPILNTFSFAQCSHTDIEKPVVAWWMFQLSFGTAYITDVTIYYREKFARRMDGFKLYVTNTSTIPPHGYLCYEDPDPGLPNITQTIPCYQLGRYVIYYDNKGSQENETFYIGPIIELCYVSINGFKKSFWGSDCDKSCSENCIQRHCHPSNGSCVWGCNTKHCLNDICDIQTAVCTDGCKPKRTGNYCNRYNIASDGLVAQSPSGSQLARLAHDGNIKSCSIPKGATVTFQVDLLKESIVTGVHITFGSMYHSGIGPIQLNNLFTSLNLPNVSESLIRRRCEEVGPILENIAQQSVDNALFEEGLLTKTCNLQADNDSDAIHAIASGSETATSSSGIASTDNTNPVCGPISVTGITASVDGAYQRRGSGRCYNSLSGTASMIGKKTGKVVGYSARYKRCRKCDVAKFKKRLPTKHKRRKNWCGSAKSMEPDMIVEILKDAKKKDTPVITLIGDDDCTAFNRARCEVDSCLEKVSDINHVKKNISNRLHKIKGKYKELSVKTITALIKSFSFMLAQNKGDSDRIKNSLPSVVLHQFGNHDGCGDWCQMKNKPTAKHRNLPWGADLKDENLKKDLLKVFTDLDPGKMSKLDSSNPNESFNNTVRSKAPKDKHYSESGRLAHRLSAAVCQKNEGYKYVAQVHEELGLSPGIATTVTAAIRDKDVNRKRTVAKTKEFKLQRLKLKSQRSSETRSHEIREGDTYCSNVIESTTMEGNHTVYASNTSTFWKFGTIVYKEPSLPIEIHLISVFRYLTYVPPVQMRISELEVCEIGIVGCPPSQYGPLCNQSCPRNCHGPCDLETGICIFGCSIGWIGDTCEHACQAGSYGTDCLELCSTNCLNLQCNAVTGKCFQGCYDGWQGSYCNQKCPTGLFGRNCSQFCEGCISRMCDPTNGLCDNITTCNLGYVNGKYCNIISAIIERQNSRTLMQIGLFIGGFLLGALIAPAVCFLVMKYRKAKGKDNIKKETQSHEQQHDDDVRMENRSTYQDLTNDSTLNEYDQINKPYVNHQAICNAFMNT